MINMSQDTRRSKVRDSSIELLRIIVMIMIVFHHFAIHGNFDLDMISPINRFWYNYIVMGGKIGVNVFVFISGYHLIDNNKISVNWQKILKFIGQVLFYSIVIFVIGKLMGVDGLGSRSLIKACFPITFSQWWFASGYFVLYLFHPFLNKLLHSLDKSSYQKLILMLVICWSVIPTFTTSSYQSNSLLWFVTLYSISGYIKLHGSNSKFTAKHYFISFLICSVLTYSTSVVFTLFGRKWDIFSSHATYFYDQEKVTTLLISLCLFMFFVSLKINYNKCINIVASATFGVYLIHDHSIIRQFLWVDIFQNAQYQDRLILIPYSIAVVVVVFAVCSLIDLFRQQLIERPFMFFVRKFLNNEKILFARSREALKDFIFGK
jgi:surface polysaccharide O-acyltransferase-like enzyme